MKFLRVTLSVLFLSLTGLTTSGAEPEIIAKARAFIGGDAVLDSVRSVKYQGKLQTVEDSGSGEKPVSYEIEIIFQKPYQHRIVLTKDKVVETTALNDYEAWHQLQDRGDKTRWRTELFPASKVKQIRASCWENLAFFRGLDSSGGSVVDEGVVQVDGKPARKLNFVHGPGIVYSRFFNPETGQLIQTETDQGVSIREEGEMRVGGIRFPQRIVNATTKAPTDAKDRVVTITIEKVTLNDDFPEDYFRVPLTLAK